jgi:hypothetical protein
MARIGYDGVLKKIIGRQSAEMAPVLFRVDGLSSTENNWLAIFTKSNPEIYICAWGEQQTNCGTHIKVREEGNAEAMD